MALLVKHNRAEHTHENEQFRRVASSLKQLFKQRNWSGILIGNPFNSNYSRFRPDAILVYDFGFLIIDFKVYSGTLKLPGNKTDFENTQWYAESDNDKQRVLIKAGNRFINPFRQLNSYREAFKEVIENEIHLNGLVKKSRTCAVNIFSGPLSVQNSIPKEIPFYKITQEADLGTFLYDYSSENSYSKELADSLNTIFNAEDWHEHIELPKAKHLQNLAVEINDDVDHAISEFLRLDGNGILVLESMSTQDRDNWVRHILSEALTFDIPQIETWIHSARIGRKISTRLGVELQSLFNTVYGGAPKTLETEYVDSEERQFEEQLQEVIPIRSDDSIDESAVIILHEAHLVTRSLHQSELLRFGSGRLLEDVLKFLNLEKNKRKLICIGDPYSLTYGKDTECALNIQTLAEMYDGGIKHYQQKNIANTEVGKLGLRLSLAQGIDKKLFNELNYPWQKDDLIEVSKEEISKHLLEWFSASLDSEPTNTVMVYSNKDAKKINNWIKINCLKNGKELAPKDLLLVNNNINIPDETGFGQPTKLYNGMYLQVENVAETITKLVPLRQSKKPIALKFTKITVKCLSIPNKLVATIWLLNNFFESEDRLSKEEQIGFRVFVNMLVADKIKDEPFEGSFEYIQLHQNKEFKVLLTEEKELKRRCDDGEKVKTKLDQKQREVRGFERKYFKFYRNRILSVITQTDPLVNAVYVNYGWSITVHKCIGSTFTNAIINTYQGENKGITNAEYYRWLYSGITATSNTLRIANPQIINPLIRIHFEDTTASTVKSQLVKKNSLSFVGYEVPVRLANKFKPDVKENVVGCICELSKLIEPQGYLFENVEVSNEYLSKASFSIPQSAERQMIIAINNKGAKENWIVSSIRVEKAANADEKYVTNAITQLFSNANHNSPGNSAQFPTDFRASVYLIWKRKLENVGYSFEITESHNNQDIIRIMRDESVGKFRVWYGNDGFFTQLIVLEKTEEILGENIRKWLLDVN